MSEKLERAEQKGRDDYSRLVEKYEDGSRYKDITEIYDSKISMKDQELLKLKEEISKMNE